MSDCTPEICGETLILLPERAVYWPRTQTLFIADLHIGKAATFRSHAIPVPEGTMQADLDRLSAALSRTHAGQLIILGDLLHSALGRDEITLETFSRWQIAHSEIKIKLVIGNHDRRAGELATAWNIETLNGPVTGPEFVLNHEPYAPVTGYALTGHLHPAIQLVGKGKQRLKVPCFWFGKKYAVLPAFSRFTGGMVINPLPGDEVFLMTDNTVIAKS